MSEWRAPHEAQRRRAGMCVALSMCAMRLSELIIIYLAAAAPFGVAGFLRRPSGRTRTRSIFNATGASLVWPLALASRALVRLSDRRRARAACRQEASLSRAFQEDAARRALLAALYLTEDIALELPDTKAERVRGAAREAIASVERYVGLSFAVAEAVDDAAPEPRETELCRLAGRDGDDLRVAARCHRRRNLARLRAHHAQSRLELLHALAELRESGERTHAKTAADAHASSRLAAALLESYARAFELFTLCEDEDAARRVARLLDAASSNTRQFVGLHTHAAPDSQAAPAPLVQTEEKTGNLAGDEPCTTSTPHTPPRPRPQATRSHA